MKRRRKPESPALVDLGAGDGDMPDDRPLDEWDDIGGEGGGE